MKIWIDIKNPNGPAFFRPFINEFIDHHDIYITSREYVELVKLLNTLNVPYTIVGRRYGGNKLQKLQSLIIREFLLFLKVPDFNVAMCHGNIWCTHVSKMRSRKVICFDDNEKRFFENKLFYRFIDFLITPNAISIKALQRYNIKAENIIRYHGFKEDIYIADFKPDPSFLDNLLFKEFVTIRPEASQASYVAMKESIVPGLIKIFNKENINVLFLPRYGSDRDYVKGTNVFIPKEPLNGLDVCYYSKVVLTGSGTFAREAACMGIPAVSFYPSDLLAVDRKLVDEGKMFHSRNIDEVVDYVINSKKKPLNLGRCKKVQKEVLNITKSILEKIEGDIH